MTGKVLGEETLKGRKVDNGLCSTLRCVEPDPFFLYFTQGDIITFNLREGRHGAQALQIRTDYL